MPAKSLGNGEYLCYKIVLQNIAGGLVSAIVDDPELTVTYNVDEWARSVCEASDRLIADYGLLAFASFRSAKSWCDRSVGHIVFEAIGRGQMSTKKYPKRSIGYSGKIVHGADWWTTIYPSLDGPWPRGTVMFREIKLVQRVWG